MFGSSKRMPVSEKIINDFHEPYMKEVIHRPTVFTESETTEFYEDFRFFGEIANSLYNRSMPPWAIHEINSDENYERIYNIYYNSANIGRLRVWTPTTFGKKYEIVQAVILIDKIPPRIIPFNDLHLLIGVVGDLVGQTREEWRQELWWSLLPLVWHIDPEDNWSWTKDFLELTLMGEASSYFRRVKETYKVKINGVTPHKKWKRK